MSANCTHAQVDRSVSLIWRFAVFRSVMAFWSVFVRLRAHSFLIRIFVQTRRTRAIVLTRWEVLRGLYHRFATASPASRTISSRCTATVDREWQCPTGAPPLSGAARASQRSSTQSPDVSAGAVQAASDGSLALEQQQGGWHGLQGL